MRGFIEKEPAIAVGCFVFVAGSGLLMAGGVSAESAVPLALGFSGLQTFLTRRRVTPRG